MEDCIHLFIYLFLNLSCQPQLYIIHLQPQSEQSELGQQSLNGCVDVPSCGDECLQVCFAVDEAHGVELVKLVLETNLWGLKL